MTAFIQSITAVSVLINSLKANEGSVIASEKSCYGPDYTQPFPFAGVTDNYCIHGYFDNADFKNFLKINLTYGDTLIGEERLSDIDPAFEEKSITDPHFPSTYSFAQNCSLRLGFDDVFISDEWATICPKFLLECSLPYYSHEWYQFECFSVGDDDKDDIPQITGGVTDFTFDLLSQNALTEDIVKDLFVSPFSITNDLVMAMMAAKNQTLSQIANVFGITKANYDIFNSFDTLVMALQHSGTLINRIDNRLWINSNWQSEISDEFKMDFQRFGNIIEVNYKNEPAATQKIVKSIRESTNNLIKHPLENRTLSENTVMLFTNAMYLSAKWLHPFETNVTEIFRDEHKKNVKVIMMKTEVREWNRYNNSEVEVIEIPLHDAYSDLSFIMIRPTESKYLIDGPKSTIEFEKKLNRSLLTKWLSQLDTNHQIKQSIMLPFLEMYNMQDITGALQKLGITDLFDKNKCDLTGLTKNHYRVYETDLNRQDKLKFYNDRIEIASFTSDGGDGKDDTDQGFKNKHADLPFLFLVMDRSIDLVLYAGRVTNPKGWRIQNNDDGGDDGGPHLTISVLFLIIISLIVSSYCVIKFAYNMTVMKLSTCDAIPHILQCKKCIFYTKRAVLNVRSSGLSVPGAASPPERYAELVHDDML